MTVAVNIDRNAIELTYDTANVEGDTIDVVATNPDGGDISERTGLANDGRFTWTFPQGYSGTAEFVVSGSDGGEDSGTVQLG